MNSQLSYIASQSRNQDLLRAAQCEHRFDAAQSQRRTPDHGRRTLHLGIGRRWLAVAIRRAAVNRA